MDLTTSHSAAIPEVPTQALEGRLKRSVGQEIPTPQGMGVLQGVEAGIAVVLMEQRYTVRFPVAELVGLEDEVCALCRAPATEWCAACGQPVCAQHQGHGLVPSGPTPYMVDEVLARLTRYGTAMVRDADLAYAAAALAQSRHLGGVEVQPPEGARKGVRLVLRPA